LTWQKGAQPATQYSNTTSLMDLYAAPSTIGKILDVMCFKRAKNKSSSHGKDLRWLWMSYRFKVEGMQALTLYARSSAQPCMPVVSQCLTWTGTSCIT